MLFSLYSFFIFPTFSIELQGHIGEVSKFTPFPLCSLRIDDKQQC